MIQSLSIYIYGYIRDYIRGKRERDKESQMRPKPGYWKNKRIISENDRKYLGFREDVNNTLGMS